MKKNLLNSILFKTSLVVLGLLFAGTIFAQTTILNGQTVLASDIPINTPVTINAGGTLDMDVARTFTNLGTANSGISTISGAAALTVSGQLTVPGTNTLSTSTSVTASTFFAANVGIATATLAGTGSFNIGFMNIYGSANGASTLSIATALTVQTGSINTGLGNPFTTFFLIVSGTLKISGAVDINLDGFTCNNGSTVEYNGAAQTVYATDYHHLVLSGSGSKTLQNAGGPATFTFAGNVTIDAGSTLANNNKTMNVNGNWTNNGAFTQGTGTVILNGSTPQSIGGAQPTTFSNITFANTNGGISLTKPTTVTGDATFTSGIVTSDAINILIFNNNATSSLVATNAATTSYVIGPVRKVGNDIFTFPIGAATGFVPLTISAPDNNLDAFTAQYFRGVPVDNINITAAGINHISGCDYWDLAETNDAGAANTISATFYWNANNPCNGANNYVTDPGTVRAVHYTAGSWSAASAGFGNGSNAAGSVIFAGLTTFSPFALGSTSAITNPLPVVFANVKAYEKNNGVQIEWSNLTEKDVAEYTIERSANGSEYTAIGHQLPASNQNDKADYDAFDASSNAGINYYRIKAQETTGKIVYSKVLSVDLGKTNQALKLYPNPVSSNQVTFSLSNIKRGMYSLRVINAAGQDVYKQTITTQGSSLTQTLELPASVKPGVYRMIVTGYNYRENKMFIVQ